MLPAAKSLSFTAGVSVFAGRGILRGYTIANDHATDTATVKVLDGSPSGAEVKATLRIPAGTSKEWLPDDAALLIERTLRVTVSGGTVEGVVYFSTSTPLLDDLAVFDDDTSDISQFGLARLLIDQGGR